MRRFRCYDNIAPNAKCQRVRVLALCLVNFFTLQRQNREAMLTASSTFFVVLSMSDLPAECSERFFPVAASPASASKLSSESSVPVCVCGQLETRRDARRPTWTGNLSTTSPRRDHDAPCQTSQLLYVQPARAGRDL